QKTWQLAVGHRHGANPGNIVGAIANEAKLLGPQINGVDVRAEYTLVRLPAQLPAAVIERLSKVRIRGQTLDLREASESEAAGQTQGASQGSKAPRLDQLSLCSCGTTHACATQGTCRLLISVGFRRVAILRSRISPEQR